MTTYRNFRTVNSGLGNLAITFVMALLGIIGLSRPNERIGAADLGTPIPQPTIELNEQSGRARLALPSNAQEETARVIDEQNLTEEPRTMRGIDHDRDYVGPSTLIERGQVMSPSTTESFESDLGGIPLLPEAGLSDFEEP